MVFLQVESMCVLLIFYETEHFEILMKRMNDVRSKKKKLLTDSKNSYKNSSMHPLCAADPGAGV